MRYTFTINHKNKAAEVIASNDRNFEQAILTAEMLQGCFPEAKIEINRNS